MGNKQSKKMTAAQKEAEMKAKYEKLKQEELTKRTKVVKEMTEAYAKDKSFANGVDLYSQLLTMNNEEGAMEGIVDVVGQMKTSWDDLIGEEVAITREMGKPIMEDLRRTRKEYFLLLLKTRKVIKDMITQCLFHKEDVQDVIDLAELAMKNGNRLVDESQKVLFDQSIAGLMKWIDETRIRELIEEWNELCNRMKDQKTKFQLKIEEIRARYKGFDGALSAIDNMSDTNRWMMNIGSAISCAGAVCAFVALFVTHPGGWIALAVIAGVAAVSAVVLTIAAISDACRNPGLVGQIKTITNELEKCIHFGQSIHNEMEKLEDEKEEMKMNADRCKTRDHWLHIKRAMIRIQEHLSKYDRQAKKTLRAIDKACSEYVKST